MKAERSSEDFYSNCLIEAVKAKIKDPKHIKLFVCWPMYNQAFCPHVMWSDGKADYDFGTYEFIPLFRAWTIHRGHIRKRALGFAQKYIDTQKKQAQRHKKYQFIRRW